MTETSSDRQGVPEAPPSPPRQAEVDLARASISPPPFLKSGGLSVARIRTWSSRLSISARLFLRAKGGDASALNRLFARLLPSLQQWAKRRLPLWARGRLDTGDLVQEAFLRLFHRLDGIEPRRRGALRAYLQESIRNRIRDEIRRAGRVEVSQEVEPNQPGEDTSPLDQAISAQNAEVYRKALSKLSSADQELIVGRLELGYSYEQLAVATGRGSADAARVAVRRALLRLAEEIRSA